MIININQTKRGKVTTVRSYRVGAKSHKGILKEILCKEHGGMGGAIRYGRKLMGVKLDIKKLIDIILTEDKNGLTINEYRIGTNLIMQIQTIDEKLI